MDTAIWVALIGVIGSCVLGIINLVVASRKATSEEMKSDIKELQTSMKTEMYETRSDIRVMNEHIKELDKKVEVHNEYAKKFTECSEGIIRIEGQLALQEERIKVANNRIKDLEQ